MERVINTPHPNTRRFAKIIEESFLLRESPFVLYDNSISNNNKLVFSYTIFLDECVTWVSITDRCFFYPIFLSSYSKHPIIAIP
ncbi:MAG: hypothetical protein JNM36_12540 [Chitinophagales bacterium]|nr:hypothetical protein [Chitinophagales bacterium]